MRDEVYEQFRERNKDFLENVDVAIGDGWMPLIDTALGMIRAEMKANPKITFRVQQIKEKFGGMRFYVQTNSLEIRAIVEFVEAMADVMCEDCGTVLNVTREAPRGWIKTRCRSCHDKRK